MVSTTKLPGTCPKCNSASMYREAGEDDIACLSCGHIVYADAAAVSTETRRAVSSGADPMEQLIQAARDVLKAIEARQHKHEAEATSQTQQAATRKEQARRITKALEILGDATPTARPKRSYTAPVCPNCGTHPASSIHKVRCKKEAA